MISYKMVDYNFIKFTVNELNVQTQKIADYYVSREVSNSQPFLKKREQLHPKKIYIYISSYLRGLGIKTAF